MISAGSTTAQSSVVLANALQLGAQILEKISGNEISNSIEGSRVTKIEHMQYLLEVLRKNIKGA